MPGFVITNEENASPVFAFVNVILESYDSFKTAPKIPGLFFMETSTSTVDPGNAFLLSTLITVSLISLALTILELIGVIEKINATTNRKASIFFAVFIVIAPFMIKSASLKNNYWIVTIPSTISRFNDERSVSTISPSS